MKPESSDRLRDLIPLAVLLLVGLGIRGYLLWNTEVLARDGIGYIYYASRFEREAWGDVLRSTHQHPLYPLQVYAVAQLVQPLAGSSTSTVWQTSAQLANMLGGLLLLFPLYLLGKELFDRWTGFLAALVFLCLPVAARVTSDTLTEGSYLFFVTFALYGVVRWFRVRNWRWLAAAGFAGGLAYLVRPEGALVLCVAGVVLLLAPWVRSWQIAFRPALLGLLCMGLAALLAAAPYWYTIGRLSNKPTFNQFLLHEEGGAETTRDMELSAKSGSLLFASRFSPGTDGQDFTSVSIWYALLEMLDEVSKGFFYVFWIPAGLGVFWFRRRILKSPGLLLVALVAVINLLVLWRLAYRAQYVSERHTLLIVLCGLLFAIPGLYQATDIWNPWWRQKLPFEVIDAPRLIYWYWSKKVASGLLVLMIIGMMFQTLRPLHGHRRGHREAGAWLATVLRPEDALVDPYGLANFYAGRPPDSSKVHRSGGEGRLRYLVIEAADQDAYRKSMIDKAVEDRGRGEPVFSWPSAAAPTLVVYVAPETRRRKASAMAEPLP